MNEGYDPDVVEELPSAPILFAAVRYGVPSRHDQINHLLHVSTAWASATQRDLVFDTVDAQ